MYRKASANICLTVSKKISNYVCDEKFVSHKCMLQKSMMFVLRQNMTNLQDLISGYYPPSLLRSHPLQMDHSSSEEGRSKYFNNSFDKSYMVKER